MKRSTLYILILILAFAGLVNTILIHEKTSGVIAAPCFIVQGCDTVLHSVYARAFGEPLSVWGMVYYGLIIIFSIGYIIGKKEYLRRMLMTVIAIGLACSLYFLYLQIFVLGTFCSYCLLSLIDTVALTFLMGWGMRIRSQE